MLLRGKVIKSMIIWFIVVFRAYLVGLLKETDPPRWPIYNVLCLLGQHSAFYTSCIIGLFYLYKCTIIYGVWPSPMMGRLTTDSDSPWNRRWVGFGFRFGLWQTAGRLMKQPLCTTRVCKWHKKYINENENLNLKHKTPKRTEIWKPQSGLSLS